MSAVYQVYTFSLGSENLNFACPPGLEALVAFSSMHARTDGSTTLLRTTNLQNYIEKAILEHCTPEWCWGGSSFWSGTRLLWSNTPPAAGEVYKYLEKMRQISTMRTVLKGGVGAKQWRSFGAVHEHYANLALRALDRVNVGRVDPFLYIREVLEGSLEHAETRIRSRTKTLEELDVSALRIMARRRCPRMTREQGVTY